jgi:hypothetical protein
MLKRSQIFYVLRAGLCAILLTICGSALAQSGRRVRKPVLVPVPTVEPTAAAKPAEKPKTALTFLVGIDQYGSFAHVSTAIYDGVLRSCAERLDQPESVKVEVAQRDMGRGEAIDRAKAGKEAYVVWLQIRPDMTGVDNGPGNNPGNTIWIEYSVFAPATAKLVTSGRTYRGNRNRGILGRRTADIYGDEALNQAAREAAARILAAFKIYLPGDRFPRSTMESKFVTRLRRAHRSTRDTSHRLHDALPLRWVSTRRLQ